MMNKFLNMEANQGYEIKDCLILLLPVRSIVPITMKHL